MIIDTKGVVWNLKVSTMLCSLVQYHKIAALSDVMKAMEDVEEWVLSKESIISRTEAITNSIFLQQLKVRWFKYKYDAVISKNGDATAGWILLPFGISGVGKSEGRRADSRLQSSYNGGR